MQRKWLRYNMELIEHERIKYTKKGLWVIPGTLLLLSFGYFGILIDPIYQKMYRSYGENTTCVLLTLLIHHVTFIVNGLVNIGIGALKHPFFEQYKINPKEWPWKSDHALIRRSMKTLALNFTVILPGYIVISKVFGNMGPRFDETSPSYYDNMKWIPLAVLIESIVVYMVHYLFHTPWFYRHFHKQHHEYTVSIGIAAEYAHPVEYIFMNLMGASFGLFLIGSKMHYVSFLVLFFFRVNNTLENHCGYDFPWSPYTVFPFTGKI